MADRIDYLCRVACDVLRAHPELGNSDGLRAVTIVLEFNERTGALRNVIYRPDYKVVAEGTEKTFVEAYLERGF